MKRLLPWLMVACLICFMSPGSLFAQNPAVPEDSIYAEQGDSIVEVIVVSPEDTLEGAGEELTPSQEEIIKGRMAKTQKTVPLTYNTKTRSFVDYFTVKNPTYCRIMERRRNLYFPIFEATLKRYNMPDEIKYLSIVESGLNPMAVSHAGAAGLWQFMPATGRDYGLKQDEYIDERLDPWKASDAACRYLRDVYRVFNDWELALASYNCGPGNIRRGIKRSGYKNTFWGIYNYIPSETRGYVPQFVAITYSMNYLPEHNIPIDSVDYAIAFDTIMITQYMNTSRFCEKTGICMDDLRELNPALKRNEIPAYLKYSLRIPKDQMSYVLANRQEIMEYASVKADTPIYFVNVRSYQGSGAGTTTSAGGTTVRTKIYHTVKRGESLGLIAQKYRVTVNDIKRWNGLRSTVIQPGKRLVIYRTSVRSNAATPPATAPKTGGSSSPTASGGGSTSTTPSGTKIVYVVKSGESLYSIAAKYKVTVTQLKSWNKLTSSTIQVGQKLIIYTPASAPASNNNSNQNSASSTTIPKYYKVQQGDTLWSISQKYQGLTVDRIKQLNNLKSSSIQPGQTLQLQ